MSDRGSLENLKQEIVENIYTNENQAVTGDLLQDVLIDAVDTMGVSVSQNTSTGSDGNGTILLGGSAVGKYAGAEKLIKLVAFVSTQADLNIGDIYYNTSLKQIREKTGNGTFNIIPFFKGAIYQYNETLYIWNGTDLVAKSVVISKDAHSENINIVLDDITYSLSGAICSNEVLTNQNKEEFYHIGYELGADGSYSANASWISSGDIPICGKMRFSTNYNGNIYCYSDAGYLGRVNNRVLLPNTTFIRMNWQNNTEAPYFYVIDDIQLQERDIIIYEINNADLIDCELNADGGVSSAIGWRTSSIIKLESGKRYVCDVTGYYYYYDVNMRLIERINTNAFTVFTKDTSEDAVYMRTNVNGKPIGIYEIDVNGKYIPNHILRKGVAEKCECVQENELIINPLPSIGLQLPPVSRNCEIQFIVNSSIYKQPNTVSLFDIGGICNIFIRPKESSNVPIYCDTCESDILVRVGNSVKSIPLRINNYGHNLFSLRLKYPVVEVNDDGQTTMITPLPQEYEGMYISKSNNTFAIHYADDSVFKSYTLSNYNDVDAFVDELLADSDVNAIIEVKKYGCEGCAFSDINNFDKILLCKQHTEVYYEFNSQGAVPTGNVYWDSYPTFIRSSDIGYEHTFKFCYCVDNGILKKAHISIDGMYVRFDDINMPSDCLLLSANSDIISSVITCRVTPYELPSTPLISMQHDVVVSDTLLNANMKTSTMRQYDMLAYLANKGFVGQNYTDCVKNIRGSVKPLSKIYCITFDDWRKELWTDIRIREIFNQFNANPTLVYLFNVEDCAEQLPPAYALTPSEYNAAKNSGWDIIMHGFTAYTDIMSYAQFMHGFNSLMTAWLRWYGESIKSYNPHGHEIVAYQFYLLKSMGIANICSAEASLGWYCECGTSIDVEYKRVNWMDNELLWTDVTEHIDEW